MWWLVEASNRTGKDNYAHIVEDLLGKTAGFFLHITFIILTFGFVVLYLIDTAQFMPKILTGFGVDHDTANGEIVNIATVLGVVVMLLPLSLQRDLSSLAHFSAFGIFSIIYVVILIMVQTP
jgi:amino acid permease